jgi:predicted kinase
VVRQGLASDATSPLDGSIHIEVDALFDLLLPDSDRGRDDRLLAYDAAHTLTRMLVERGRSVVLECTYARRGQRASLVRALPSSTPLWVAEIFVTPGEAAARFRSRHQDTDLDVDQVRERAENFPYSSHALRLDSLEDSPPEIAKKITDWLRAAPRSADRARWVAAGRPWPS